MVTASYNPIVRTFGQLRAVLVETLGLVRHEVRPATPLEVILPEDCRREVWRELRRRGLHVPALELPMRVRHQHGWLWLFVLINLVSAWWHPFTLIHVIIVVRHLGRASHRQAVEFPFGIRTVGELAICATDFAAHKESGYRWTPNEIALKVRLAIAESQGLDLEDIRHESKLFELGAE